MSSYTPLYRSIWNDVKFTQYTPEQQLIFIHLISNSSCQLSGIYQIAPKQIASYTNIKINKVVDSLKEFDSETLLYDSAAGVIFIKNHFKHNLNKVGNPKTMIHSLIKNSKLTNHEDFWIMFVKKYNKEINNLVSRIKDFEVNNIFDCILVDYLINPESNKYKASFQSESSLDPDLISISISNSNKKEDIKVSKEVKKKNEYSEEFETFWKTFLEGSINTPLGSKKKAYESYKKCLKSHNDQQIIEGLKAYLSECKSKNTYTTAATTFLNQERYTDYLRPVEVIEKEKQKKEEIKKEKQRIRGVFKINKNHPKFNEIMSTISFLGEYTKKINFIHAEDKRKIFITDSKFNRDWIDREFGTEIGKAFGDYKVITKDQYKLLFG